MKALKFSTAGIAALGLVLTGCSSDNEEGKDISEINKEDQNTEEENLHENTEKSTTETSAAYQATETIVNIHEDNGIIIGYEDNDDDYTVTVYDLEEEFLHIVEIDDEFNVVEEKVEPSVDEHTVEEAENVDIDILEVIDFVESEDESTIEQYELDGGNYVFTQEETETLVDASSGDLFDEENDENEEE